MKRTHLLSLALFIAMFAGTTARAQITAPFAAGLRGSPDGAGINLRFFFNENVALEAQGSFSGGTSGGSGKSLTGTGLLEYHFMLGDPRLRMFVGVGAHYGSWVRYKDVSPKENYFGFDGILGFEYVFENLPVGISLDAKPSFNFVSGVTMFPNNTFGLSVRYYFGAWEDYDSHYRDKRE